MNAKALLTNCIFSLVITAASAQTPCQNGMAGEYPCNRVDLLGYVSAQQLGAEFYEGVWVNDIWGWTDPQTGREYALVGMTNGTSFVDVTEPTSPVVIGVLPEHHSAERARKSAEPTTRPQHIFGKSVWRDIKVYQNHAFIVADADSGHGMQVFDLTQLRTYNGTRLTFRETAHYTGVSSAHNIAINEDTGFAYIVGADEGGTCGLGGLHIVNIQDPRNPIYAGCFDDDGYTHDAQVVSYYGPDTRYTGREIAFAANEDAITIVNVSNKVNPQMLASERYSTVAYTHQGWLTPDYKYFIANDELDEYYGLVPKTRSYIWDVQDLENPRLIGEYSGPYNTIDHNLYTRDNYVFESNYTSGLRILDASDIARGTLTETAYFDTYPTNNRVSFDGNWSNYPYFTSGNVVISDIQRGLFVLKPIFKAQNLTVAETLSACAGNSLSLKATSADTESDRAYQWQILANGVYTNLTESAEYSGVNSLELTINQLDANLSQARFRLAQKTEGESFWSFSNVTKVNVDFASSATFQYTAENSTYSFSLTETPSATSTILWYFGDGTTSRSLTPAHKYTEAGTYTVELIITNECGEVNYSQTITIDEAALGFEDEFQRDLTVYPNPASGEFTVASGKQLNQLEALYLYSPNGKLVRQITLNQPVWEQQLSTYNLTAGYYLLRIVSDKTSVVRPVVIQ